MKFNFVFLHILCALVGPSFAYSSGELKCKFVFRVRKYSSTQSNTVSDEADHCCKMGRMSKGPTCNLGYYTSRNSTTELCRHSFNLCCQKRRGELDCMAGIRASMNNENCWAFQNQIDYQVNIFIHLFSLLLSHHIYKVSADTGQNNFSILDLLLTLQYWKGFYACNEKVRQQQKYSLLQSGQKGMLWKRKNLHATGSSYRWLCQRWHNVGSMYQRSPTRSNNFRLCWHRWMQNW